MKVLDEFIHRVMRSLLTPAEKQQYFIKLNVDGLLRGDYQSRMSGYEGDALLQKSYTVDFLTKTMKANEGEVPQYYIENSHPAIIAPETFDLVQEEFCRRKAAGKVTKVSALSGRIVCADCGGYYGRKVWHAGCTYATTVWHCNNKFAGREHCTTPTVKEEAIKQAFVAAFNSLLGGKKELFAAYEDCLDAITDDSEYRKQNEEIAKRCLELTVLIEQLVMSNTRTPQPTKDFDNRYNVYVEEFDALKEQKKNRIFRLPNVQSSEQMCSHFWQI